MTEKAKKYLSDILESIRLTQTFIADVDDFFSYQTDFKTKSAVERQLGIIGEAVNQFRKAEQVYQLTHTKQTVDFRNRLIHSYDSVDDTIVWTIVRKHLPILEQEVLTGLKKPA